MGAVVTQLVCIMVSVLIYLPFVKIAARLRRPEAKAMQPELASLKEPS